MNTTTQPPNQALYYFPTEEEKKQIDDAGNKVIEVLKPLKPEQQIMVLKLLIKSYKDLTGIDVGEKTQLIGPNGIL